MKVTRRFNQIRRDLSIDLECESCGNKETYGGAYDDRNFWDNVVPEMECGNCGKSTKDLEEKVEFMPTRYAQDEVV